MTRAAVLQSGSDHLRLLIFQTKGWSARSSPSHFITVLNDPEAVSVVTSERHRIGTLSVTSHMQVTNLASRQGLHPRFETETTTILVGPQHG